MPPKNMISVTRNTHMPSVEVSSCCALSSNWCCNSGSCGATIISLSANIHLLLLAGIIVGRFRHHWLMIKVEGGRRCGGLLPLQALGVPRILRRPGPVPPGPGEVDHRY